MHIARSFVSGYVLIEGECGKEAALLSVYYGSLKNQLSRELER